MNTNRVDFSYPLEHKIVITPSWLLGFVEAEGSFYVTKLLEPAFAIALNEKESALIQRIKEFLIENLNFDDHSKWKLKESGLIGIHHQNARGTTKGAVRIIIRNISILNNYLIPFFSYLEFKSKKGLDFEDFKLICNNIYIGAHLNQEVKVSLLKLINTMNNKRLSNSKTPHITLTKDELVLLNNLKPIYKHLSDGSVINMDSGKKVSQYSIYVLTYEDGEIKRVSTRDEIASELNVSLTTISKHLNLNPEGVTFKNCHVKKIGVFSK
jgi:LAGLIDADG endonuclease